MAVMDYIQSGLDPVLQDLLSSIDYSGQNQWQQQFQGMQEEMQRRRLGSSGIAQQQYALAGRQHSQDIYAQKQSAALALYEAWLKRRQQQLEAEMFNAQRGDQAAAANKANRGAAWGAIGQLAGMSAGNLFKSGGGGSTAPISVSGTKF